jgi:hypothetical protein
MGISRGAASATLSAARSSLQRALGEPVTDEFDEPDMPGGEARPGRPSQPGQDAVVSLWHHTISPVALDG